MPRPRPAAPSTLSCAASFFSWVSKPSNSCNQKFFSHEINTKTGPDSLVLELNKLNKLETLLIANSHRRRSNFVQLVRLTPTHVTTCQRGVILPIGCDNLARRQLQKMLVPLAQLSQGFRTGANQKKWCRWHNCHPCSQSTNCNAPGPRIAARADRRTGERVLGAPVARAGRALHRRSARAPAAELSKYWVFHYYSLMICSTTCIIDAAFNNE